MFKGQLQKKILCSGKEMEDVRQRRVDRFLFPKLPKATGIRNQNPLVADDENTHIPITVLKPNKESRDGILYFVYKDSAELYSEMGKKINLVYRQLVGFPKAILPTPFEEEHKMAIAFIAGHQTSGSDHFERVEVQSGYCESDVKEKKMMKCKLIDSGYSLDINVNNLYLLLETFSKLPARIYEFQLADVRFYRYTVLLWTFIYKLKLDKNPNLTVEFTNKEEENRYPSGILRDESKPTEISINEKFIRQIIETYTDCVQFDEVNSVTCKLNVTFVTQNAEAFVQSRYSPVFIHLRTLINRFASKDCIGSKPNELSIAQMYIKRTSKKSYQRVRIIRPITSKGAKVHFIDLGMESDEIIPAEELIPISGIETLLPAQCVRIKFCDIITHIPDDVYSNYPQISNLYRGKVFKGVVLRKDYSEDVPITLELFYIKDTQQKILFSTELLQLLLEERGIPDEAALLLSNVHVGLSSPRENIHQPHQSVFPINWINPKYVVGAELKVFVENVANFNDITLVEFDDKNRRESKIRGHLKKQQEQNQIVDFTYVTGLMLKETEGMALFMIPMDGIDEFLSRAAVMKVETKNTASSSGIHNQVTTIQAYLMDYGVIQKVLMKNLRLLIPRYFYVDPPMAIKAELVQHQRKHFKIRQLMGSFRNVRILSVEYHHLPMCVTQTRVKVEIIS